MRLGFLRASLNIPEINSKINDPQDEMTVTDILYVIIIYLFTIFSGSAAQRGLWPPVALQPSAGYGLLVYEVS
jgi:hypothetical protein